MKILTRAEFDVQRLESTTLDRVDRNVRGFNTVKKNINKWSSGSCNWAEFTNGVKLVLCDGEIHQDCNVKNQHDEFKTLVSKFYLSGHHGVVSPGIKNVAAEYIEQAGQDYLFYLPNIEEIEQFFAGTSLQIVKIYLDSQFLRSFVTRFPEIPQQLKPLIEKESAPKFHRRVGELTPMMRTTIQQIWQHPYSGAIANIYLEGKTLELLAMQLDRLTESNCQATRSQLKPKTIDRIYQAKDILATRLEDPPSIQELTQQIGISELTLRRGFRELFDTTVIGYLTLLRMKQAEVLLREQKYSVAEVSNLVGYSHLGYFAKVFKRHFGITPSECLAGKLEFNN